MEPPNLRITPYLHGHACESCRSFSVKDGEFRCGRFDLKVPSRAICDDYDFAGHPYRKEPVPETQVSARPPLYEYLDRPRRKKAKTGLEKWIGP
jgi:hypothetical protein